MLLLSIVNVRTTHSMTKKAYVVAVFIITIMMVLLSLGPGYAQWRPAGERIATRWARTMDPDCVLSEYPRPGMVRSDWKNLNGLWEYAIRPRQESTPEKFDGHILVPFAVESSLSGVMKVVGKENVLWYRTRFQIPPGWRNRHVVINFGAVDWESVFYLNGRKLGEHRGGYDSFSFDISSFIQGNGEQELIVSVWDPTDEGTQPRGKQVVNPRGIWYSSVTGIWQTVWIEPVGETRLETIKIKPDIDNALLQIITETVGCSENDKLEIEVYEQGKKAGSAIKPVTDKLVAVKIKEPRLWSPDSPFLYDLKIRIRREGKILDEISSYAGMRKVSVSIGKDNQPRIFLNNKFLFQMGLLDQGWWPDGLYTAPSDEALQYDIAISRQMGYNLIRKHVKVEPARWYYHCDRLGMLVWQDMPSGEGSAEWKSPSGIDGKELDRIPQSAWQYEKELKAMIDQHYNYPSIIMWVPFNEAWGQFNTVSVLKWVKCYDPSRLVDGPSGGNNFPVGDVIDRHQYPGPGIPQTAGDGRALVLGEFGGLGFPVEGHTWADKNWGYKNNLSCAELKSNYSGLISQLPDLIRKGLSAAVYTQTTDVETEMNGWLTYDREELKIPVEDLKAIHRVLFE